MKASHVLLILAAAPLLSQCAQPAKTPPKPEWAFDISATLTPEAINRLKVSGDKLVFDVYYFGMLAPGSKEKPDELGRVRLGNDYLGTDYNHPVVHVTGADIDQSLLKEIKSGEVNLQITAYGATPDNIGDERADYRLECTTFHGTTEMARTAPAVITCDKYKA